MIECAFLYIVFQRQWIGHNYAVVWFEKPNLPSWIKAGGWTTLAENFPHVSISRTVVYFSLKMVSCRMPKIPANQHSVVQATTMLKSRVDY